MEQNQIYLLTILYFQDATINWPQRLRIWPVALAERIG